jgi:hypothetical protein
MAANLVLPSNCLSSSKQYVAQAPGAMRTSWLNWFMRSLALTVPMI